MRDWVFNGLLITALLLSLPGAARATSPPPIEPDQDLLPLLYDTLGGDDWHRNDGWLDPDVHWCDWYGVDCADTGIAGVLEFRRLQLPDNNLNGTLTPELAELLLVNQAPERELDLSGNRIGGELTRFPWRTIEVNLSGNALTGPLPELEDDMPIDVLGRIRLARNEFSGTVPASWERLQLRRLDLADNRLDAGVDNAIAAIHPFDHSYLYLNGNRFTAELGPAITQARGLVERGQSNVGAGIDLCFNDFTVPDPEVRDWIAARHVGSSDFEACLGRERAAVDATISGSWYHPGRSGEGISIMLLENGAPLLYSFGFDTEGGQQWLFELGTPGEQWLRWDPVRNTGGHFGEGVATDGEFRAVGSSGRFRADRLGPDTLSLHRHYLDILACGFGSDAEPGPGLCPPPLIDDRLDYHRLSRLAGTTCDNQDWAQQFSGAWYDPERSGEGFLVEILPDRRVVLYWFTYRADGSGRQAWMVGNGNLETPITGTPPPGTPVAFIDIDTLYQPTGATYGDAFDPADVVYEEWGSLRLEFFIDGSGQVVYDSNLPAYGSGSLPIEQLARPMLADCE
jgi:hypothetical protein